MTIQTSNRCGSDYNLERKLKILAICDSLMPRMVGLLLSFLLLSTCLSNANSTEDVCAPLLDLVVLLDTSVALNETFEEEKRWVTEVARTLPLHKHAVRMGLVKYGTNAEIEFSLSEYSERSDIISRLDKVTNSREETFSGYALQFVAKEVLERDEGIRPNSQRMLLVFTDGLSMDDPKKIAEYIREKGVKIIVVDVKNIGFIPEMLGIAGDPANIYGPDDLERLLERMVDEAELSRKCASPRAFITKESFLDMKLDGSEITDEEKTTTEMPPEPVENDIEEMTNEAAVSKNITESGSTRTSDRIQQNDNDNATSTITTAEPEIVSTLLLILETLNTTVSMSTQNAPIATTTESFGSEVTQIMNVKNITETGTVLSVHSDSSENVTTGVTKSIVDVALENESTTLLPSISRLPGKNSTLDNKRILDMEKSTIKESGEETSSYPSSGKISEDTKHSLNTEFPEPHVPLSEDNKTLEFTRIMTAEVVIPENLKNFTFGTKTDMPITVSTPQPTFATLVTDVDKMLSTLSTTEIPKKTSKLLKSTKSRKEDISSSLPTSTTPLVTTTTPRSSSTTTKTSTAAVKIQHQKTKSLKITTTLPTTVIASFPTLVSDDKMTARPRKIVRKRIIKRIIKRKRTTPLPDTPKTDVIEKKTNKNLKASQVQNDVQIRIFQTSTTTRPSSSTQKSSSLPTIRTTPRRTTVDNLTPSVSTETVSLSECPMDILFIVDSSGSVKDTFSMQKNFLTSIISKIEPARNHRVGLIQFAGRNLQKMEWSFDTHSTNRQLMSAMKHVRHFTGTTYIGAALDLALALLDTRRAHSETIVVLVSDGFSQDDSTQQAKLIRQLQNVTVYGLSLNSLTNTKYLLDIVGDRSRLFMNSESEEFVQLIDQKLLCNSEPERVLE